MIHTTMYVSTLADELTSDALDALLRSSRAKNEQTGITGLLVVQGRRVMQMLEGEQSAVRRLYAVIADDLRHRDVVTVWDSNAAGRRFPNWSMAFDDLNETADTDGRVFDVPRDGLDLPERSQDDAAYARRRGLALRRALVSGEQLVVSLAIILQGHRPEEVLGDGGALRLRCAECHGGGRTGGYPCNTARNALWAIESTLPRT